MRGMLIAYDEDGNVTNTRSYQNVYDEDTGEAIGTIDFLAAEAAGIPNTAFWKITKYDHVYDDKGNMTRVPVADQPVKGSKVWPEYLGGEAHQFRVILAGPEGDKRIVKLVHRKSGVVRDRAKIEKAIEARKAATPPGEPVDLRDLVGGPQRPLKLDEEGRTAPRVQRDRPKFPVISRKLRGDEK
jgi:hypothetical protein